MASSPSCSEFVSELLYTWIKSAIIPLLCQLEDTEVNDMCYISLVDHNLRNCAHVIRQMRTYSIALGRSGSENDAMFADGWMLDNLMSVNTLFVLGGDTPTNKTMWGIFIAKIFADSVKQTIALFDASILAYYKLMSVLEQMQTKARQLNVDMKKHSVEHDVFLLKLIENTSLQYMRAKSYIRANIKKIGNDTDKILEDTPESVPNNMPSKAKEELYNMTNQDHHKENVALKYMQNTNMSNSFTSEYKHVDTDSGHKIKNNKALRKSLQTAQDIHENLNFNYDISTDINNESAVSTNTHTQNYRQPYIPIRQSRKHKQKNNRKPIRTRNKRKGSISI